MINKMRCVAIQKDLGKLEKWSNRKAEGGLISVYKCLGGRKEQGYRLSVVPSDRLTVSVHQLKYRKLHFDIRKIP